jgi:hypothetical protein
MSLKRISLSCMVLWSLACLLVGMGAGKVLGARLWANVIARNGSAQGIPGVSGSIRGTAEFVGDSLPGGGEAVRTMGGALSGTSPCRARLEKFRTLLLLRKKQEQRERTLAKQEALGEGQVAARERDEVREAKRAFVRALQDDWEELQDAANADPALYFAFLRAPENQTILYELLLVPMGWPDEEGELGLTTNNVPSAGFARGLLDLLSAGTRDQKLEALRLVPDLGMSEGDRSLLAGRYRALLSDADPRVQSWAFVQMESREARQHLDLARELWTKVPDMKDSLLHAISTSGDPASEAFLLEKMGEGVRSRDEKVLGCAGEILGTLIHRGSPEQQSQCASLLASAIPVAPTPSALWALVQASVDLPLSVATSLLEQARPYAGEKLQRGINQVLGRIRMGETRTGLFQEALQSSGYETP